MKRKYLSNSFLSPDVIDASIDTVHALAAQDRQKIALAGGVAMQLYGSDRLTADVDVIAEAPISGLANEGELAIVPGYKGRLPNGVAVDVITPGPAYEWFDLFDNARRDARPLDGGGIAVVSREYMVSLKMMAGREDKDLGDLYILLTDRQTDLALSRRIVRTELGKYAVQEFDQIVAEAAWAMSRRGGAR